MKLFAGKGKRIAVMATALLVMVVVAGTLISRAFAGGVSVKTAKAERKTLSVTVSVSGKTEADRKADVFAPAAGTLAKVLVTDGQEVTAGQPLAEMDADSLDAAVDAARTAYDGAASQLEAIDAGAPSGAERDAAAAGVKSAKRAYDQASDAYDKLHAARSGDATLSAAQTQKEAAYAAYLSAKAQQKRLSSSGDVDARRKAARTSRDTAEHSLDRAQATRKKAVLRAPMDGVVIFGAVGAPGADGVAPKATAGCAVSPAAAVFTVVDLRTLTFAGQLDENDVARVRDGIKAGVTLDAAPGREMSSTVAAIDPTARTTANGAVVFPVRIKVPNADESLRIGMSGNAVLYVDDVTDAVAVPIECLVDGKEGEQAVFVVESGKLAKRTVKTGVMTETDVEIVKGLKAGETVAIAGDVALTGGMAVQTGEGR